MSGAARRMAKHPLRYWFWRLYVPTTWLIFAIIVFHWLFTFDVAYLKIGGCLMPFYLVATLALCQFFIIPFDYSLFGKYRRTPFPDEPPLRTMSDMMRSGGIAGRYNMGFVVWCLFKNGIGMKTLYGKVFLPLDEIDALELDQGFDQVFYRNATSTLHHSSPEIRGPIYFPRWIAKVMAAYYPQKVLVEAESA